MANMLKDLEPLTVEITLGGEKMYLRYNLNARRYLEEDTTDWTAEEVIHILRAGLIDCFYNENEEAIEKREFEKIKPSMAYIGRHLTQESLIALASQILEAIILSMPISSGDTENFTQAAE